MSPVRTRVVVGAFAVLLSIVGGCASTEPATLSFQGFTGCEAGADSAIVFLQRTLDRAADADPAELGDRLPTFDRDVRAMLLRAREVHCTEEGFNAAIVVRVNELTAGGPGGARLLETVRARGLGSLDEARGGLIRIPGD